MSAEAFAPTTLDLGITAAAIGVRLFVGGVFLLAASHKLTNRLEFSGILRQYRLLPKGSEAAASVAVPMLELCAALMLLFAPPFGAVLAAGLLASYALAIGINLQRGRQHIDCGCGGDSVPLSPGLVWRNLTMVLLLGALLYPSLTAPTAITQLIGSAFALGLCALYICYNQLQANAGIYRRLWLGERTG